MLVSLTAAAVVYYQGQWEDFSLAVIVESEGGREEIQSRKKIPNTYHVFLPGYDCPYGRKHGMNRRYGKVC